MYAVPGLTSPWQKVGPTATDGITKMFHGDEIIGACYNLVISHAFEGGFDISFNGSGKRKLKFKPIKRRKVEVGGGGSGKGSSSSSSSSSNKKKPKGGGGGGGGPSPGGQVQEEIEYILDIDDGSAELGTIGEEDEEREDKQGVRGMMEEAYAYLTKFGMCPIRILPANASSTASKTAAAGTDTMLGRSNTNGDGGGGGSGTTSANQKLVDDLTGPDGASAPSKAGRRKAAASTASKRKAEPDPPAASKGDAVKEIEARMRKDLASINRRVVIPDMGSGSFVAKLDDNGRVKVGFASRARADRIVGSLPNEPDGDVFVFVWTLPVFPTSDAANGGQRSPMFSSRMARLRRSYMRINGMWTNYSHAEWMGAHPPVMTESVERDKGFDNMSTGDVFADAMVMPAFGVRPGSDGQSFDASRRMRINRESIENQMAQVEMASTAIGRAIRHTLVSDVGEDVEVERLHSWQTNQYQIMAGRRLARPQMPMINYTAVAAEQTRWFETVCMSFGIPHEYMTRARSTRYENASNSDTDLLRRTVKEAREAMASFAASIFEEVFREAYNDLIADGYLETRDEALRKSNKLRNRLRIVWRIPAVNNIDQLITYYKDNILGPYIIRKNLPNALGLLDG